MATGMPLISVLLARELCRNEYPATIAFAGFTIDLIIYRRKIIL
jgi:hypothetical protein